jgi:hypothetical protein
MALTIELEAAIATTRTSGTITDETVYGTGGNPARSAVGVFLSAYKVDYENSATALTVTGDDGDPDTDSAWTFEYTIDGFYRFYFAIIPDYDVGTTYSQYQAVFDSSTGNVYRSVVNGNVGQSLSNTSYWESVADASLLAANKGTSTESTNITSTIYLRVFSANSQYTYGNQLSEQCLCSDCDEDEALRSYNIFAKMLDEVAVADSRSEVLDGELICRRIQSTYIDC